MERQIIEYLTMSGDSANTLDNRIAAAIAEGWQPLGGLAVVTIGFREWRFFQPMVRYAEPAPDRQDDIGADKEY